MHTLGPSWLDPQQLLDQFGSYALWGALLIVFVECGLFIFMLPGDALLFTVGLFAAEGGIPQPLPVILILLVIAAFAGNVVGYEIGRAAGPRVIRPGSRLIKQKHVDQTHEFFEKYGAKALILGRFVPIVRTFITLIAGVGRMDRGKFYLYSGIGAVIWGGGVTTLGYFLGQLPFVKKNIEIMLIAIVLVSVVPIAVEWLRARRHAKIG
ncbi:MAG: DedA family protein [Angustibacter sp.]